MPKLSLNPEHAKQGGGGIEAGKYRVKAAKNQNIKTDYRANQLYLVLDLIQLDANWQPVREAEEQELRLSYGAESLKHFRPAVAKSATDPDPVPQSDAPDAEGNTIFALDSEPVNRSCAVMVMMDSLMKHGFPKATLDNGYAPDFVGMEFELASYSPKECNEKFGTRLNTKPMKDKDDPTKTVDITYKVAVKWNNPNYLSGASTVGSATTTTTTAAQVATANESPEELAAKVLKVVIDKKKGSEIKSAQAVNGFVTNAYTQHNPKLPASQLSAVQALVKDPASLAKILVNVGVDVPFDDETGEPKPVTYPLAIPA